jgi:hypothetical protein
MATKPPGLDRVITVLGAADAIAHLAFFWIFAWRAISSDMLGRVASIVWAVLAALGLAGAIIGRLVVKYGGRTPARRVGVLLIGASTALAGFLLVVASGAH